MCRSDQIGFNSDYEAYELSCETCGHSEVFVVTDFDRKSDNHWLG